MMTDIEIAQSVKPRHILDVAKDIGIDEKYIELHGKDKAKIDLEFLSDTKDKKAGKLILVTAITPVLLETVL